MDRYTFLSRKQLENESLEHFHAALTALAAKCQFRELETELVRDLFITNMNNLDLSGNSSGRRGMQRLSWKKPWPGSAGLQTKVLQQN